MLALVVLLTTGAVSECDAGSSNWPEPPGTRPHGPWLPQMSPDGSQVVFALGRSIFSVSSDGSLLSRIPDGPTAPGYFLRDLTPDISPDGSRVAYSTFRYATGMPWDRVHSFEIATSKLDGTDHRRLTSDEYGDGSPAWSPDGSRIAFVTRREGFTAAIYTMSQDGTDERFIARAGNSSYHDPQIMWSPDGRSIAFTDHDRGMKDDKFVPVRHFVSTVRSDGTEFTRVMESDSWFSDPAWSPDSQSLVFNTTEDEHTVLYLVDGDGATLRRVFSINRPFPPSPHYDSYQYAVWWSPDGSEIRFYAYPPGGHVSTRSDGATVRAWEMGLHSVRPDGTGFRTVQEGLSPQTGAGFSPDGSRLIVARFTGQDQDAVLYTTALDGSEERILARYVRGDFVPENSDWRTDKSVERDVDACWDGTVVRSPKRNPGLVRDCQTLLQMRDTLAGEGVLLRWGPNQSIDAWEGITIGGGLPRVVGLGAPPNHFDTLLQGSIPPEIGQLTGLKSIQLFNRNSPSGPIPPELGNLKDLETLVLTGVELSGSIPPELGNLAQLKTLRLDKNNLTGEVPAELGNLTQLTTLYLHETSLTGCIPSILTDNPNLKIVSDLEPC